MEQKENEDEPKAQVTQEPFPLRVVDVLKEYGAKEAIVVVIQLLPVISLLLIYFITGYRSDYTMYASNIFVYVFVYCMSIIWQSGSKLDANTNELHIKTIVYLLLSFIAIVGYVLIVMADVVNAYEKTHINGLFCMGLSILMVIILYGVIIKSEKEIGYEEHCLNIVHCIDCVCDICCDCKKI